MIVPKLLHVIVQPVFVLVDTETLDVQPGPVVQGATVPAAQLAQLDALIDQAKAQIAEQLQRLPLEPPHGDGVDD